MLIICQISILRLCTNLRKKNVNADYCSRIKRNDDGVKNLCLREGRSIGADEFEIFVLHQIAQLPINAEQIARETRKDPSLGKIVQLLEAGTDLLRAGYKAPEVKYSLAANCLLFEHRVVIPSVFRQSVLNDLHVPHIGIVKMEGLARSFVYLPGIDADIEKQVKSCSQCSRQAHAPPKFSEHHWQYPKGPWERIHIDYAGPVAGSMLLIVVDSYSKWLEVKVTQSTTTAATIGIMDELFSSFGVPRSGVKYHKLSAPYHPATNGQAERYVQTTKDALKAMGTTASTLQSNLNIFLQMYRLAPHATTGDAPSKLFLGRILRTRLDLLKPKNLQQRIVTKQQANFQPSFRVFSAGQPVYILSGNCRMDKWIPGVVTAKLGDLHYEIEYAGKRFRRHIDQIRFRHESKEHQISSEANSCQQNVPKRIHFYGSNVTVPVIPSTPNNTGTASTNDDSPQFHTPAGSPGLPGTSPSSFIVRRSTRDRHPPCRYSP
ncbi:uncharacterized protein K02A2.6-like [Wyeomyia smithii]|uniref:uncharacterized protein K02A2.6-like n=1 Tax=Wyeomyia smithii TaxID=174621 RepID=UPI002467FF6B|nr:uncharacterized protein K02A2.6-like [Wyeomyia smithii]